MPALGCAGDQTDSFCLLDKSPSSSALPQPLLFLLPFQPPCLPATCCLLPNSWLSPKSCFSFSLLSAHCASRGSPPHFPTHHHTFEWPSVCQLGEGGLCVHGTTAWGCLGSRIISSGMAYLSSEDGSPVKTFL